MRWASVDLTTEGFAAVSSPRLTFMRWKVGGRANRRPLLLCWTVLVDATHRWINVFTSHIISRGRPAFIYDVKCMPAALNRASSSMKSSWSSLDERCASNSPDESTPNTYSLNLARSAALSAGKRRRANPFPPAPASPSPSPFPRRPMPSPADPPSPTPRRTRTTPSEETCPPEPHTRKTPQRDWVRFTPYPFLSFPSPRRSHARSHARSLARTHARCCFSLYMWIHVQLAASHPLPSLPSVILL